MFHFIRKTSRESHNDLGPIYDMSLRILMFSWTSWSGLSSGRWCGWTTGHTISPQPAVCCAWCLLCGIKVEAFGFLAITLQIPSCRTHAAEVVIENFPRGKSDYRVKPQIGQYRHRHFFHHILHILLLNVKQFQHWLSFTQWRGDINYLADKPVSLPLQCAIYALFGTFAVAGFEVVPGSSCKSLVGNFTREVTSRHFSWISFRMGSKCCHIAGRSINQSGCQYSVKEVGTDASPS